MKSLCICLLALYILRFDVGFQAFLDWAVIVLFGIDLIISIFNKDFPEQ